MVSRAERPLSRRFEGVFAALTTPFIGEDIAVKKFRENIARYNGTELAGYVVLGSTGEAVYLSDEEAERLASEARASASPGKVIIAGASKESTKLTIAAANRMAALGADAVLIKPPHYYKSRMGQAALRDYYLRVADESKIPVIIYNIPQNTGVAVEPPLTTELSRHLNIAGVKDSSGILANLAEVRPAARPGFHFLLGTGSILLPGLLLGADGGILAMAAAVPELCVGIYSLFREERLAEARELQLRLTPLNKALTQTMGVPAIKYALDVLGFYGGPPRSPLQPLDEAGRSVVRNLLLKLELIGADAR
jgi:4-hydroxy-2-oxoglutarate aldolase